MYSPQEDSYMLLEQLKKYAKGKVLDMGTGSGIQALEAAKKENVESVLAVDINKKVINELRKKIKNPKIKFIVSDLFSSVVKKYDCIIFNPPYLPQEEIKGKKIEDIELYGGRKGYEIIKKFFSEVSNYLEKDGIIIMVFSSLSAKKEVDKIIKLKGFNFEELSRKHIFFEDLYVYLVKKVNSFFFF